MVQSDGTKWWTYNYVDLCMYETGVSYQTPIIIISYEQRTSANKCEQVPTKPNISYWQPYWQPNISYAQYIILTDKCPTYHTHKAQHIRLSAHKAQHIRLTATYQTDGQVPTKRNISVPTKPNIPTDAKPNISDWRKAQHIGLTDKRPQSRTSSQKP